MRRNQAITSQSEALWENQTSLRQITNVLNIPQKLPTIYFRPTRDRIVVLPLTVVPKIGSIFMPSVETSRHAQGLVLASGPGRHHYLDRATNTYKYALNPLPNDAQPGDLVLFESRNSEPFNLVEPYGVGAAKIHITLDDCLFVKFGQINLETREVLWLNTDAEISWE